MLLTEKKDEGIPVSILFLVVYSETLESDLFPEHSYIRLSISAQVSSIRTFFFLDSEISFFPYNFIIHPISHLEFEILLPGGAGVCC
jgi:hypothetical protein